MKHRTWAMVVALGLTAAPVFGQGGFIVQSDKQAVDKQVQRSLEFVQQAKMSVIGRVTKGAPYSAETVSESVQALPDGNRIVNRTTTKVSRDSEGRTRTEQVEPSGTQIISISDPVSGITFMLYPQTHTAVQNGAVIVHYQAAEGLSVATSDAVVAKKAAAEKKAADAGGAQRSTFFYSTASGGTGGLYTIVEDSPKNATREELGEQVIEGVLANGTRTTTVIAAGAIGNDQPIRIVSEEWLCKDLGILVMSKHSDPRTGETSYRVTNINRAEPDPSLFQVPADYKVQQSMIKREGR
jgi:hypothetical protein